MEHRGEVACESASTIAYYDTNAQAFYDDTATVEFSDVQDRFLALLPKGASILDFGCGSGRDTRRFARSGYAVCAVDGSEQLCAIAAEHAGVPVRCELFSELAEVEAYDGIWACASILHLGRDELVGVLAKMRDALKPCGVMYASFKYGSFEGMRNDRWFTDQTEASLEELVAQVEGVALRDVWVTSDVRPGRDLEKWLNCLICKDSLRHGA